MRRPTLGAATGLCLAAIAAVAGASRLSDNSFLTHLATGRLIVEDGHIPRSDPYTFTAHGEPWVVQSWLASALFGVADRLAGLDAVRLLVGALAVGIFAVLWRLTRPAESLLPRAALGALVVAVGASEWSERPLLIGLLALALTVLCAEGGLDARWLLPVGWVWVNSHGSFPLGLAFLVVAALGRRLDGEPWTVEAGALRWLGAGVALGAVNPLGPRLLLFPVELLGRQEVLREVVEWQAPTFTGLGERLFLLQVVLAILAVARRGSLRSALLVAVFVAAALVGSRNIAVASIVLVPTLAAAAPALGRLRAGDRTSLARPLALVGVAAAVLVPVASLRGDDLALDAYPVRTLDALRAAEVDLDEVRLVAPDRVGNLLSLREGEGRAVFVDDRFDMFPEDVLADALALSRGSPRTLEVLDDHEAVLVLAPRPSPLLAILEQAPDWGPRAEEDGWVLFCRRGADLGGTTAAAC